jgi:hypothetical protein
MLNTDGKITFTKPTARNELEVFTVLSFHRLIIRSMCVLSPATTLSLPLPHYMSTLTDNVRHSTCNILLEIYPRL